MCDVDIGVRDDKDRDQRPGTHWTFGRSVSRMSHSDSNPLQDVVGKAKYFFLVATTYFLS